MDPNKTGSGSECCFAMEQCACLVAAEARSRSLFQICFRHGCSGEKVKKSCLLLKEHTPEAAHPILLASTAMHAKSQSTTISGVTLIHKWSEWHLFHDSFLLWPLKIQHPLNPGKRVDWTSWWNNIPFWPQCNCVNTNFMYYERMFSTEIMAVKKQ